MKPMKVAATNAAAYYCQQDPLFSKNGEAGSNAVWVGSGTAELGLKGDVDLEAFQNLLHGFDPSGEIRLVGRESGEQSHDKNACTDIQLTSPKSFSVAALFDPSLREAIQSAAIKTAEYVDANHAFGRQTQDGITEQVPGQLVASLYMHSTSRSDDIHIHGHLVALNMTVRPDGSLSCLENRSIFENQAAITQSFYTNLEAEVKSLGYGTEYRIGSTGQSIPELAGYRQDVNALFSKRHESIKDADQLRADLATRLPHLSNEARESLVQLKTKAEKSTTLTEADLIQRHTAQLESIGISPSEYLAHLQEVGQELKVSLTSEIIDKNYGSQVLAVENRQSLDLISTGADNPVLESMYAERLNDLKEQTGKMTEMSINETGTLSLESPQSQQEQGQQQDLVIDH